MILPDEPDEALMWVLGRPNFQCGAIAPYLREQGMDIPPKSELEQAHVIFWLLGLYAKHGDKVNEVAACYLKESNQTPANKADAANNER